MFQLDLKSKKSIHEQIIDGIKGMIVSGEIKPDDKLPSVRDLSTQLTVNPNTIAKAFKSLEAQGWIYTVSGRGCFVSEIKQAPDYAQVRKLYGSVDEAVRELLFLGISEEEILKEFKEIIEKGRGEK